MSESVLEAANSDNDHRASLYVFPGALQTQNNVAPLYSISNNSTGQQQQQQQQQQQYGGVQQTLLSQPTTASGVATISSNSGTATFALQTGSNNQTTSTMPMMNLGPINTAIVGSRTSSLKTHARSASHGGVLASGLVAATSSAGATARPSALKKPGHQRAFSQGQVVDVHGPQPVTGHSRVGSKTDFILPPGHREDPRPSTGGKVPSFRGHSRQASRSESIYTIRRSAAPPWWRRLWARCFGPTAEEPRLRTIVPNHLVPPKTPKTQHPNGLRVGNRVRTTKYTALSFLPRNLLEQFHRVANIYFLSILLLNWIPAINAFGKEVAMLPVIFVLGVTALKDFFEDRRRFSSDQRVNNSTCRVYVGEGDRYKKVAWKDVKVGDLVHLSNNELVPADLLLLRSSDPQGLAYLDTCNLDGETNLKQRQVVRGFLDRQNNFQPSKFRSVVEVDQPSTRIYRFHGAVVHSSGARVPVSTENLLLRECLLKNTDFVEGIVVYAGHETKAMLNNGGPRYKRSRLERQMNLDVIWCVFILVVLCLVGAVGCRLWLSAYPMSVPIPFLPDPQNPTYEGMLTFLTFVIILQVMIPLSLYVTIEMAKVVQVYHIGQDSALYDPESDRRAECRALNITEELGQVQYVFSDKTGTLTENKMVFRRCTVSGQDYAHTGEGENLVPSLRLKEDLLIGSSRHKLQEFLILLAVCNTVVVNTSHHHDLMNASGVIEEPHKNGAPTRYARLTESRSVTPSPPPPGASLSSIQSSTKATGDHVPHPKLSRPKLLGVASIPALSINMLTRRASPTQHRSPSPCGLPADPPPIYEAESPDELALVFAARAYDVKLLKRMPHGARISLPDKSILDFEILKVLPFDSSRKCMSIVVRHPQTREIVLYTKGADTTIMASLAGNEDESASNASNKIRQLLHSYARQGLRTLAMARRTLTPLEFETWLQRHTEAELAMENRERRVRDSYASLESHLTLLGATGIEDKLQAGVPEAIAALIAAGIVIWVLTGDKPETAVNIAYSARLFSPSMQLLWLQARSKTVAESLIHGHLEAIEQEHLVDYSNDGTDSDPTDMAAHRIGTRRQRALVVDGKTLTFILDPRSGLTASFLELTRVCTSVLACRATPLQKAYIVRIVKEQLGMRTLAIGDGANDVSMIQTADVGIGVSGREGTQAVMAADFSIARFPLLTRLLLLHGHWCYDRLSRMILYFFYKNATFVFLIFWYQLYCGFSGAVMVDQIYLMMYNLLFTSLPPIILGVYDQLASAGILLASPPLYVRGRLGLVYQPHSFWITMADALYQSIVIFFVTEAAYHDSDVDIWEYGTTIMSSCMIAMLLYVTIETRSWTIIHIVTIIMSLGVYFGFCLVYNHVCVNCMGLPGSYWVMQTAISRHIYWLTVIVASVVAMLPRLVYRAVKTTVSPDIVQKALLEVSATNRQRRRIAGRDQEVTGLRIIR
ncbi:phospholipid-transporting ATPase VD isoform X2 [Athalia rosae]|uniref:phospholipid-transporting ATPase VD isoform X2 n=1 Tax=Athalia rosae TaxID=37344 RepID=UPI0020345A81|nr:phospholipid-transporting ATPase VD isoform X2 [Athalia rosae]